MASQLWSQIPQLLRMTRNCDFLCCAQCYDLMTSSCCWCHPPAMWKFWAHLEVIWPLYDHFLAEYIQLGQFLVFLYFLAVQIMPNFGHSMELMHCFSHEVWNMHYEGQQEIAISCLTHSCIFWGDPHVASLEILESFGAHLRCAWPFGHFASPRTVF